MTGVDVAFLTVGAVALTAAVLVVTSPNLVHAALWLVLALTALGAEYLLLAAEFLAWVQILIYVGAVVVLLLFGLMLTRAPIGRSPDLTGGNRPAAAAVAATTAATLVTVTVSGFRTATVELVAGPGSARGTGQALFRYWVLPFEALSVLLLAALVGALVLSRTSAGVGGAEGGRTE